MLKKGKRAAVPPRNLLATPGAKTGRRALVSHDEKQAQARHRWELEQKHGGAVRVGILHGDRGRALPLNPREAARQAGLTGADAVAEKARAKAGRKVQKAKQSAAEAAQRAAENDAYLATFAAPAATAPTNRPPRIEAGRYGGLKDGRPG